MGENESHSWTSRHALWLVGLAPLLAQFIGSAFNIWYNIVHVQPLLTDAQLQRLFAAINHYNLVAYPLPILAWIWILLSLRKPLDCLHRGQNIEPAKLLRARRRVINLPWWAAGVSAPGWLLCIPFLLGAIGSAPGARSGHARLDLAISILISALIALTHACALVEILSQRLLFPVFFRDTTPEEIPCTHPITLRGRGALWIVCVVACPVISLLLLIIAPDPEAARHQSFAATVAVLCIVYGFASAALLLGHFVVTPIQILREAARKVASGNLGTRVELMRADEFGPLISQFNRMVSELLEKERVVQIFGRHVGRETARQILDSDPGLGGVEKEITVLFSDIRNFTARCSACSPQEGVALLNIFFTEAVAVIESHGGIVNKFLGDGIMAIFGAAEAQPDHAARAVEAGRNLLQRVRMLNETVAIPLEIGVGIHTGLAVVGSIGAPERMEYTAIGDTVNTASRVESLTKEAGRPLLLSAATFAALGKNIGAGALPPMRVKGKTEPLTIYAVDLR